MGTLCVYLVKALHMYVMHVMAYGYHPIYSDPDLTGAASASCLYILICILTYILRYCGRVLICRGNVEEK